MVMASHALTMPGLNHPLLQYVGAKAVKGFLGVQLFFVISGFIISYLLLNERRAGLGPTLRNFYARRVVRIVPPLAVYLGVLAMLSVVTEIEITSTQVAAALLFFTNHIPFTWLTGHFWSLSVEEQFYLLWPLILLTMPLQRERLLWAAVAIAPAVRLVARVYELTELDEGNVFYWLVAEMDLLAAGCLLALNYSRWSQREAACSDRQRAVLRVVALGCFPLITAMPSFIYPYWEFAHGTIVAAAGCYLILSLTASRKGTLYRLMNASVLTAIGVVSYDLYIWQQLFLSPQPVITDNPALALVLAGLAGTLSWHGIGRPLLQLRRRLRKASGEVPGAPRPSAAVHDGA